MLQNFSHLFMGSSFINLSTIWDARRFLQRKVGTMHFFLAQENVDYRACGINFFEQKNKIKSILLPLHVIQEHKKTLHHSKTPLIHSILEFHALNCICLQICRRVDVPPLMVGYGSGTERLQRIVLWKRTNTNRDWMDLFGLSIVELDGFFWLNL